MKILLWKQGYPLKRFEVNLLNEGQIQGSSYSQLYTILDTIDYDIMAFVDGDFYYNLGYDSETYVSMGANPLPTAPRWSASPGLFFKNLTKFRNVKLNKFTVPTNRYFDTAFDVRFATNDVQIIYTGNSDSVTNKLIMSFNDQSYILTPDSCELILKVSGSYSWPIIDNFDDLAGYFVGSGRNEFRIYHAGLNLNDTRYYARNIRTGVDDVEFEFPLYSVPFSGFQHCVAALNPSPYNYRLGDKYHSGYVEVDANPWSWKEYNPTSYINELTYDVLTSRSVVR